VQADHVVGTRPLESLDIEPFDELRQGQLPRLLLVVVELPELPRIHPQLARHLDLLVREMKAPLGFEPRNQLLREFFLMHGSLVKRPTTDGSRRQPVGVSETKRRPVCLPTAT
jgi:hypothetical protein